MTEEFTSSDFLKQHWTYLNKAAFAGGLEPPADIGWVAPDPELAGVHGAFPRRVRAIGIAGELRCAEEIGMKIDAFKALGGASPDGPITDEEFAILDAALGLLAHEMAHQAACDLDDAQPASHGEAFVRNASRLAAVLDLPVPTLESAPHWPDISLGILLARQRGAGAGA